MKRIAAIVALLAIVNQISAELNQKKSSLRLIRNSDYRSQRIARWLQNDDMDSHEKMEYQNIERGDTGKILQRYKRSVPETIEEDEADEIPQKSKRSASKNIKANETGEKPEKDRRSISENIKEDEAGEIPQKRKRSLSKNTKVDDTGEKPERFEPENIKEDEDEKKLKKYKRTVSENVEADEVPEIPLRHERSLSKHLKHDSDRPIDDPSADTFNDRPEKTSSAKPTFTPTVPRPGHQSTSDTAAEAEMIPQRENNFPTKSTTQEPQIESNRKVEIESQPGEERQRRNAGEDSASGSQDRRQDILPSDN